MFLRIKKKLRTKDIIKKTRLLVSGRSPECSDCLLMFYGAVITFKK